MDNKSVTIIIVLYYSKHLLKATLVNITEKIPNVTEIILIDNSKQNLKHFENSMTRVIRPPKNIGYGAAINLGIKNAKNENIIAMNPDIEILEFKFNFVQSPAEIFILSGKPVEWSEIKYFPTLSYDFLRFAFSNLSKCFFWTNKLIPKKHIQNLKHPIIVDWVSGGFILTNKKTMEIIGGFDENFFLFYEEIDLCKRALAHGIFSYLTPKIQIQLNSGTSSSNDVSLIKTKADIESAKRYHAKYSSKKLYVVMFLILKFYCFNIGNFLGLINKIKKNKKLNSKAIQYKIYASSI